MQSFISRKLACVSQAAAAVFAVAAFCGAAQAQFVVYEDFEGDSAIDPAKFVSVAGGPMPTVSGGTATFPAGTTTFVRSTASYPLGSTIRYEFTSISSADNFVFGTTSQTNDAIYNSDDSTYVRDDGGLGVYTDGTPASGGSDQPSAGPVTIDFFFGTDTITITETSSSGPRTLFSGPTPAGFDEVQRAEMGVYGNGTFVLDRILVNQVPEPASLAILGLPAMALLMRRRRK